MFPCKGSSDPLQGNIADGLKTNAASKVAIRF
jgi:hypothetical protein